MSGPAVAGSSSRRPPAHPVRLTAPGLTLRGYRAGDEPALRVAFADPEIARWNPAGEGVDVATWWRRRADWSGGGHATFAVADPDTDALLGDVSLHEIDLPQGSAELGYTVLPDARGRGVARRAVLAVTHYAFAGLGLARVQLYHARENVASCRVAHAAGYLLEGALRSSYVYGDGARHDEHLHARLATDPHP